MRQYAKQGREAVIVDEDLRGEPHRARQLAFRVRNQALQGLNLLIKLRLERESIGDEQLQEGALNEEVLRLLLDLRLASYERCIVAAAVILAHLLLNFGQIALDTLDHVCLNLPVKLGSLRRSLCRYHEGADHVVDLLRLVVLLVLAHVKRLVHEVSQVGDGWNLVTIEAIDDNLVDEAAEGPTSYVDARRLFL